MVIFSKVDYIFVVNRYG